MTRDEAPTRTPARRRLAAAGIGVLAVLLATLAVPELLAGAGFDVGAQLVAGSAVLWAIMAASVLGGVAGIPAGQALGLAVRPIDLLWGLAAGFIARGAATLVEIGVAGRAGGGVVVGGAAHEPAWWFAVAIAPVLIAPLVEETFFRGLLQRSLVDRLGGGTGAAALAVTVTAVLFALLHAVAQPTPAGAAIAGASALALGIGAGIVAAATGRLAGAVIAHATFNAILVATLLQG